MNDSQPETPLGYCPHCDYQLLGAGICPECGKSVPSHGIQGRSRGQRRRRWGKAVLVILLVVGFLFSARWAIQHGWHYRIYSDAMLIDVYPNDVRATREIERRLLASALTEHEINALVEKSFTSEMEVRSPRPIDVPPVYHIELNTNPGSLFDLSFDDGEFFRATVSRLDGELVVPSSQRWSSGMGSGLQSIRASFPFKKELAAGEHIFDTKFALTCTAVNTNISLDVTIHREAATTFEVVDRTVCEMIDCNDAPEDIAFLQSTFKLLTHRIPARGDRPEGLKISACATEPNMPLRYVVVVRLFDGDRQVSSIANFAMFDVHTRFHPIATDFTKQCREADRITCQWQPTTSEIFEDQGRPYYPFVLEWNYELRSDNKPDWHDDLVCDAPDARPPDRIIPLHVAAD